MADESPRIYTLGNKKSAMMLLVLLSVREERRYANPTPVTSSPENDLPTSRSVRSVCNFRF